MEDTFMDEQLRAEAEENAAEQRELANMTEAEREEFLAQKADRLARKDDMLRSQLGVYGKKPALAGGGRRRGGKGGGAPSGAEEPEAGSGGAAKSRKAQRAEEQAREREARKAMKKASAGDTDAEDRRQSRMRKLADLKAQMADSDDEDDAGYRGQQQGSLLDRLRGPKKTARAKNRRSKRGSRAEPLDDTPLPVTLWVFILFGFVALDRSVKFLSANANPVIMSKVLGGVLIAASFGVKVPQIASIIEARTVKGMSQVKQYTGVLALILVVVYSGFNRHPFTAWGDSLSVLVQDLVIIGLMWKYDKTSIAVQVGVGLGLLAYVGAVVGTAASMRPAQLWPMPLIATAIAHSGNVPQIITNFRNQHTGPLSFVTQLMLFLGSAARIVTTLTEMNDPIVLGTFVSSVIVQGILLGQILAYWPNTKAVLAREQRKSRRRSSKAKAE